MVQTVSDMSPDEIRSFVAHLSPAKFEILKQEIVLRMNQLNPPEPTTDEMALWCQGKKILALKAFRERTGEALLRAKTAFETPLLDRFIRSVSKDESK